MSVGTADLLKAVNTVWDASNLNAAFKALWDSGFMSADWEVLQDGEAQPGQPWPYCVIDQTGTSTVARMSKSGSDKWEVRDTQVTLHVHCKSVSGNSNTGKELAGGLIEAIMEVFGGHPTEAPTGSLELDNGNHLITQYLNDYCIRNGDDEYEWVLTYNFRLDVPVAVSA